MSFFVLADKMRYFCFQSVGIFQSINQSINQSNKQSINQSNNQSINQTINQSSINILASFIPQITSSVEGTVTSWLECSSPVQAVQVRALAGDMVLCSWARHFTLTVALSTQVNKWLPANLMLGINCNPAMD